MKIKMDEITESGLRCSGEEPAELLALKDDPLFSEESPLTYELYAQRVDEALIVRGTVSATVETQCVRCSQIFSTTVADSGFLRDYSDISGVEELDITEDLREAVVLNLPPFPLCDEACKGLCPSCGLDLNHTPCECASGKKGGAWEALDNLKL
jgi:uncharacterized protein